jgi:hypothetical protein
MTPPGRGSIMIRSAGIFGATLLAALSLATAASAEKPIREPILLDDIELSGICAFPVLLEVTANKEFVTFFSDGRIHVNGKLFARVTNLDTGEFLDLNISGPAVITPEAERGHGRGLLLLRPGEAGGPGIFLTNGRVDIIRAEDGFIANLRTRGSSVDICAALAA